MDDNRNATVERASRLIDALPEISRFHSRESKIYGFNDACRALILDGLGLDRSDESSVTFDQFGQIKLPYHEMGAISSIDLFGLDELILFSFYWINRDKYKTVSDLGANIGLHSIILSRCHFKVTAYEPDPVHFELLNRNLALNHCQDVEVLNAAVSDVTGTANFVRVLGNTTSSHLEGSKDNAYGALEHFEVQTIAVDQVFDNTDFIKMDVEGAEAKIIGATGAEHWADVEMMLEVGNAKNAETIFDHLNRIGVKAFSQKTGWSRVQALADMPVSYREGSLFITKSDQMDWG
jgi:FkbM family methyltransferase